MRDSKNRHNRGVRWCFASCPRGLEELLASELGTFGIEDALPAAAGVRFPAVLESAYRACLWSRVASRVLLIIAELPAGDANEMYAGAVDLPWEEHIPTGATIAVDFIGTSEQLRNSLFSAQRVKDAVVDRLRAVVGSRPSVDVRSPDVRISARLHRDRVSIAIDLSGEAQHRRGYRTGTGAAPLKENLAAALLRRAGWPDIAAGGGALYDPLCGSGTLLIEAALMAREVPPGATRAFAAEKWRGHDPVLWERLRGEAEHARSEGLRRVIQVEGADSDAAVLRHAQANLVAAGLEGQIMLQCLEVAAQRRPVALSGVTGLLICNPPYGERLGDARRLQGLYAELGRLIRTEFGDWRAAVLVQEGPLGACLELPKPRSYKVRNGALECRLLVHDPARRAVAKAKPGQLPAADVAAMQTEPTPERQELSAGAMMLANRLRKNMRRLKGWLAASGTRCYRVYDADMPEYAVAVDRYGEWIHVAEYAPPATVDPAAAKARLVEVRQALRAVFQLPARHILVKTRSRQRGKEQYQRLAHEENYLEVNEGPARLLVNLRDYLDTGLFLDHRPVRRLIAERARDKSFLNLFCYTASATVFAALGGARESTSVDMSTNYLAWAERNLRLNGCDMNRHRLERADCLRWMEEQRRGWDLVFLDPPSFSNSKRMDNTLDVQRDHIDLIQQAMRLVAQGGTLIFSTNRRGFRLDAEALGGWVVNDITDASFDPDFDRRRTQHRVYLVQQK